MKQAYWREYIKQHAKNIQEDREPEWSSSFFYKAKEKIKPSGLRNYATMDEDKNNCRCVIQ